MFIELVDALRCPNAHEESWLVASAARMEFRHIVEGTLGCPVCKAQYPVRRGVVDFRRAGTSTVPQHAPPDETEAARLAAFLDLTDRAGFAVWNGVGGCGEGRGGGARDAREIVRAGEGNHILRACITGSRTE